MNKSLIYALLAAGSLTGPASAAQLSDDQGNWSIVLNLNASEIKKVIDDKPSYGFGSSVWETYEGVNLVSWSGSGTYAYDLDGKFDSYTVATDNNRKSAYWLGWGRGYFENTTDSGMAEGLQMGFAGGTGAAADADIHKKPDLNTGLTGLSNAGYYRGHTKEDIDFDFVRDETASPMDKLRNLSITSATLVLVHSNQNIVYDANGNVIDAGNGYSSYKDGSAHSQTLQYLTIGYVENGETERYITFIAEVDDSGTTAPTEASTFPSSNRHDIDILENVVVNDKYVDSFLVSSDALTSEQVKDLVINGVIPNVTFTIIPEPASATLSMMALTALCARRRRRK